MQINAYLNFDGNCRQAFEFYAKAIGGKIEIMQSHGDSPMASQTDPAWQDKIIHTRMIVGNTVLMGSDYPPKFKQKPQGFSVSLQVDSPEQADTLFNKLAEGGEIRMPIQQTFWAERFGMLVDQFGIPWMVNCDRSA